MELSKEELLVIAQALRRQINAFAQVGMYPHEVIKLEDLRNKILCEMTDRK